MSAPEAPAVTDIQKVLQNQELILEKLSAHATAINALGANVQWVVDNAGNIFQMFQNPAFMANLPSVMGGMIGGGHE